MNKGKMAWDNLVILSRGPKEGLAFPVQWADDEMKRLRGIIKEYFTAAEFENVDRLMEKPPEFFKKMGTIVAYKTKVKDWISVREMLPEPEDPVLISNHYFNDPSCVRYTDIAVRRKLAHYEEWYTRNEDGDFKINTYTPTHWMPIPEFPERKP